MTWLGHLSSSTGGASSLVGGVEGDSVASATTITVTDFVHTVTGSTNIQTISGGRSEIDCVYALIPDVGSAWHLVTGGNIQVAVTPVVGTPVLLLFSGGVWRPIDNGVGAGSVTSFETRTGAVTSTAGDYTASEVTNVAAGSIAAVTVQAAITELDADRGSVLSFGAPTTSLHTVVAAMLALGYRNIYIPTGAYTTSSSILINQAGVTIRGDGPGSSSVGIRTAGTVIENIFYVTAADFTMRDIKVLGNRTTLATDDDKYQCGVTLQSGADRSLFENCEFTALNGHGLQVYLYPTQTRVSKCYFHDNGQYNTITAGARLGRGITVSSSGSQRPSQVWVDQCRFELNYSPYWGSLAGDHYGAAIFFNCTYLKFTDNIVKNNWNSGGQIVHLGGEADDQRCIISGNTVYGTGTEPTGSNMSGVEWGGRGCLVSGNDFFHLRGCGVVLQPITTFNTGARICGNRFDECNISAGVTWASVAFVASGSSGRSTNTNVSGNIFQNCGVGIRASAQVTGSVIIDDDNVYHADVTTPVSDPGGLLTVRTT